MKSQLDFYTGVCLPEPYTILGINLKPYSIGHFLLMRRFGCAFSSEDKNVAGGILDLLLGVLICSHTYEEFLNFIKSDKQFSKHMTKWKKHIRSMMKKDKNFNLLYKMMEFKKYMEDGIQIPKFWNEDVEKGKTSGAHWTQSVLNILTSQLGYTYSESLNMPMSKAIYDYFKYLETNGMVLLMTDEELELVSTDKKECNGNQ